MSKELNNILYNVAESTFGSLAFMLSMPEPDDGTVAEETTTVSVEFSGPFGGQLIMTVNAEMLPELAENMLGLEPGEDALHDHGVDALKELLNVICGNLLPKIAGVEAVFDVEGPQIIKLQESKSQTQANASVKLYLDSGMAELALYTDKAVPVEI